MSKFVFFSIVGLAAAISDGRCPAEDPHCLLTDEDPISLLQVKSSIKKADDKNNNWDGWKKVCTMVKNKVKNWNNNGRKYNGYKNYCTSNGEEPSSGTGTLVCQLLLGGGCYGGTGWVCKVWGDECWVECKEEEWWCWKGDRYVKVNNTQHRSCEKAGYKEMSDGEDCKRAAFQLGLNFTDGNGRKVLQHIDDEDLSSKCSINSDHGLFWNKIAQSKDRDEMCGSYGRACICKK